jgi:hypothetical protein
MLCVVCCVLCVVCGVWCTVFAIYSTVGSITTWASFVWRIQLFNYATIQLFNYSTMEMLHSPFFPFSPLSPFFPFFPLFPLFPLFPFVSGAIWLCPSKAAQHTHIAPTHRAQDLHSTPHTTHYTLHTSHFTLHTSQHVGSYRYRITGRTRWRSATRPPPAPAAEPPCMHAPAAPRPIHSRANRAPVRTLSGSRRSASCAPSAV